MQKLIVFEKKKRNKIKTKTTDRQARSSKPNKTKKKQNGNELKMNLKRVNKLKVTFFIKIYFVV